MKTQTSLATALLILGALVVPVGTQAVDVCPDSVNSYLCDRLPECDVDETAIIAPDAGQPTLDVGPSTSAGVCGPDCGDDGCAPDLCNAGDPTFIPSVPVPTTELRQGTQEACVEVGDCPPGKTGARVGDRYVCVAPGIINPPGGPCLTLACLLDRVPGAPTCSPLAECVPEVCHGDGVTCLTDAPCDDPTWCVRMTLCDGGPLLVCLLPPLCKYGGWECVTDPERSEQTGDGTMAPNHAAQPASGDEASTAMRIALGFTGIEAMSSTASSEQDPREARCFVYYAYFGGGYGGTGDGDNTPECVGYAPMGPHKVDAFGEIYCIHDSDCATSGTIHTYLWKQSPGDPWLSAMAGYSQFYSGGGGGCPDAPCGHARDWQAAYGTVQSTLGTARYAYDISRYMEGSECTNWYPEDPEPVWVCDGEGGFGSFLW